MKRWSDGVFRGVSNEIADHVLFAASLPLLMERLGHAMLLIDASHTLQYMSPAARRLLGYAEDEPVGCRCGMTTRGTDCNDACPLSCALEAGTDAVPEFAAVYHTRDGEPVPVRVTIVVLRDEDGRMLGAVELLSRREPELGFFLQGMSRVAARLREQVLSLAAGDGPVIIIGEEPARYDVAWAIHRAAGLDDSLFRHWGADDERELSWPPGSLYVEIDGHEMPFPVDGRDGWRILAGAERGRQVSRSVTARVLELPPVEEREEDLPWMLRSWVAMLSGGRVRISADALDRLVPLAMDEGLTGVRKVLVRAIARAGDEIEPSHLRVDDSTRTRAIDAMLSSEDPLMAMEACILEELLKRSNWKMQDVADRLGISRVTLWRKLREHGIVKEG